MPQNKMNNSSITQTLTNQKPQIINNKPKIKIIKCVIKYPKKEINKEIRKQKSAKIPKNKNKTLTPKIN